MTETDPDWQDYRRAVGDRLRAARVNANLTQEALAEKAGVSRDTVQRVESGHPTTPRLSAAWRLARAVGLPPGELLAEPVDPPRGRA